jgi:hypothetical protein
MPERLYRVYISLGVGTRSPSYPEPDSFLDWNQSGGPAAIVSGLLDQMGPEFLERNQKAWDINKSLYTDQWEELDKQYT